MLKGALVSIWELGMNLVPTPLNIPENSWRGARPPLAPLIMQALFYVCLLFSVGCKQERVVYFSVMKCKNVQFSKDRAASKEVLKSNKNQIQQISSKQLSHCSTPSLVFHTPILALFYAVPSLFRLQQVLLNSLKFCEC